jgi:hypothetical protein
VGGDRFAAKLREQIERVVRGRRRESHSGGGKREHGEQAAGQLLRQGLALLKLEADDLRQRPKVSAEKAALAGWLRERTTVSLRWVSARLHMGHYSNAGRGPRKMNPAALHKYKRARSKLDHLDK